MGGTAATGDAKRRPWYRQAGPLLVLLFLFEGVLGKSRVPGLALSHTSHIVGSALLIAILVGFSLTFSACPSKTPRGVRLWAWLLIAWCFFATLPQDFLVANLCFWLLWAGSWYVALWVIPLLFAHCTTEERLRFLLGVLFASAISCLVADGLFGRSAGRLSGIYQNATFAGRMCSLATVFGVGSLLVGKPWNSKRLLPLIALSAIALLLTRTRASIAASLLACGVMVVTIGGATRPLRRMAKKRNRIVFSILVALLAGSVFLVPGLEGKDLDSSLRFLRLDRGVDNLYNARAMNWETGANSALESGAVGGGFLAKFANTSRTRTVWGITFPTYDWETGTDPLNMFLLTVVQSGWPAAGMLLGLLVQLWRARARVGIEQRTLLTGLLSTGAIFGCIDGNWLTSFGDSVDRFCMIALGLMTSSPAGDSNRAPRTHPGHSRSNPRPTIS
jgi:hypothetical protein